MLESDICADPGVLAKAEERLQGRPFRSMRDWCVWERVVFYAKDEDGDWLMWYRLSLLEATSKLVQQLPHHLPPSVLHVTLQSTKLYRHPSTARDAPIRWTGATES